VCTVRTRAHSSVVGEETMTDKKCGSSYVQVFTCSGKRILL